MTMASGKKNGTSLRRSSRLVSKTTVEEPQAEAELVAEKPSSTDVKKDKDVTAGSTAKDRTAKKSEKKKQRKSPAPKQIQKPEYTKSTISPTNRAKRKEVPVNSLLPTPQLTKWTHEPMNEEFNASKSFPVEGPNRVTSEGGGAFQDYSNRNPVFDRTTGPKTESTDLFSTFQTQATVTQAKTSRKKKSQKSQKGGTKSAQVTVPLEHARSDQQKEMNETTMTQPDVFDRNVGQDRSSWMNSSQANTKQSTSPSFQSTQYRQYPNSVRMSPSGYDPSSSHWTTPTTDAYNSGKGMQSHQLSGSVSLMRSMYQPNYQNSMMSHNDQQPAQNQQSTPYNAYGGITYFPNQQGMYGGNQQMYNRAEYPATYDQPTYPGPNPHFDRDPQASAFNPSSSAHIPYSTNSYGTAIDSKEVPGHENSAKAISGSIYPNNGEVPPGGDLKSHDSQIDESNLTPAERRRRRKEMKQSRNLKKSSEKEIVGSKSRVDPEAEDISLRKAIGTTPDGLDILEPPRTSKRGRTPYLNAAICRDKEGRVKLQRQDFMTAFKQSCEARSKDNTSSTTASNPTAVDSADALGTKPAQNVGNSAKDGKDSMKAVDSDIAAVGKYSVAPSKNKSANESDKLNSVESEEDVDLEAKRRVEELKQRLKSGR